jgi:hypothetical protein
MILNLLIVLLESPTISNLSGNLVGSKTAAEERFKTYPSINEIIAKLRSSPPHLKLCSNPPIFTDSTIVDHVSLKYSFISGFKASSLVINLISVASSSELDHNTPNIEVSLLSFKANRLDLIF